MSKLIPVVTGEDAAILATEIFDPEIVRVSLDKAEDFVPLLGNADLWIDPCVDGLHEIETRRSTNKKTNQWFKFMCDNPHFEDIGDPAFHADPTLSKTRAFVNSVLSKCSDFNPTWLSIPQLPVVDGVDRNRLNRQLAKASREWADDNEYEGKLILPVVFMHQSQLRRKAERTAKVQQALRCYGDADANGVWIVDKSLDDDNGSPTLRDTRFPGVVAIHTEINEAIEPGLSLGGPYWALNLLLWARGLITHPIVGVGTGYQYFMAGGHTRIPTTRIAIPSLKRLVEVDSLGPWLDEALEILPNTHNAYEEIEEIRDNLDDYDDSAVARSQVVRFYKGWYDSLDAVDESERAETLYEQFSTAYRLGRRLPDMPDKSPIRPEAVSEMLMSSCL